MIAIRLDDRRVTFAAPFDVYPSNRLMSSRCGPTWIASSIQVGRRFMNLSIRRLFDTYQ